MSSARKRSASAAKKRKQQQEEDEARMQERIDNEVRASASALGINAPKFTPEEDQFDGEFEFGGWAGCLVIMLGSHFFMYYVYFCIELGGDMIYPGHPALKGEGFVQAMKRVLLAGCVPSFKVLSIYGAFLVMQWFFAAIMPGPVAFGRPIPSDGGFSHRYKCNAVWAWWTMLVGVLALWKFDVWRLSDLARDYGQYLTASVIIADICCVMVYVQGIVQQRAVRCSGNHIYDFFMGSTLNPKLPLGVDFKMLAELRVSWGYLFLITLAHTMAMYERDGRVSSGMWLLLFGHFLYSNACQKGEECVVQAWDIFYEKFGWLLIFWNLSGVPLWYSCGAVYILKIRQAAGSELPLWFAILIGALLVVSYVIFDLSNGQKNRFRMSRDGCAEDLLTRRTFPFLPWGYIRNPKTLKGKGKLRGKELFVDGLLKYARKINYTSDNVQAWCWGLACVSFTGSLQFLPFMYATFHMLMLLHRNTRDEASMAKRYGKLWEEYIELVPYRYIPGIY